MGASVLWTPGIFAFFLQENLHVLKFLVLGGGGADFIFMGAWIFSEKLRMKAVKWVVAKLQGDKTACFCRKTSGREVTG